MESLRDLLDKSGGIEASARACGLSPRALYKWASRNSLPRTEYTGETKYAEVLAELSGIPTDVIRKSFSPSRAIA
ncbi:hypothetical protein LMG33810_002424 [Carnimonas sp. LMG 33810]|uniref:DNA-binding protein n=1 Tax=Carnimonas bestiolae TaxID=3402172 RepID=UPI003EDBCC81